MSDLRMPDLNKVIVAGRLTRDPELRYVSSGRPVCKLGLALSRYYRTQEGERREETTFVNVTAWGKTAEYVGENFKKGRPAVVEGRLTSSEWEDKSTGQKRTALDITAERILHLDWEDRGGAQGAQGGGSPAPRVIEEPIPEDDIPF